MLNLLRSDLYRLTRAHGLRGELIGYGAAALAIPLGVMAVFFISVLIADADGSGTASLANGSGLYSELFGLMYLSNHVLPILTTLAMVQVTFADIDNGYEKALSSAIRGTGSRLVERIALAGVVAGALTLVAAVGTLISGSIITAAGHLAFDHPYELLPWLLSIWLVSWAYALPPLVFSLLVRNKTAGYASALYASVYPNVLFLILAMLSQLLGTAFFMDAFSALTPYFPGHVLGLLGGGAASALGAGTGAFAFAGGALAQAVLVFALWVAIALATGLAIVHRRRG